MKDERLVSKMEGKTIFEAHERLMTDPDLHILRQIYATDWSSRTMPSGVDPSSSFLAETVKLGEIGAPRGIWDVYLGIAHRQHLKLSS